MNKSLSFIGMSLLALTSCMGQEEGVEVVEYGEAQQMLTWPQYYGNNLGLDINGDEGRCQSSNDLCLVPGARNLTLQTCTPPGYSTAWKNLLNNEAQAWADYINALPNADYTITVDLDNCIQDHRVYKIFLTYGTLPGTWLGNYEHGVGSVGSWVTFVAPTENTVTIDDAKTWSIKSQFGRSNSEYFNVLSNHVWHELGHVIGFGHDPGAQAPGSSNTLYCMREMSLQFDGPWDKECQYTPNEEWQLATFHW